VVAAVWGGAEAAFSTLAERYRPQLLVHCYQMLGSLEEAEDLVQETLLRAWRARAGFQGRARFGTWLYRIATNGCLSALERRPRRVLVAALPAGDPRAVLPASSGRTGGRRRPTCPGSSPTRTDCWMRPRRAMRSPTRW
jgi:RNA polymerase sigma-70 factor, ECF subfamily